MCSESLLILTHHITVASLTFTANTALLSIIRAQKDLSKWTETCWRLTFLTFLSVWQFWHVWGKSWMWNWREQWEGHPYQSIDPPVQTLYLMQIAVYLNLMASQFSDIRRKDFWPMFIHHIATIILISYSYTVNFVRNGILVLMCHDPCDVFMEGAKLFKYAGVQVRLAC